PQIPLWNMFPGDPQHFRGRDGKAGSTYADFRNEVLAREQFLYCTVSLIDRSVGVGCGSGIGIGYCDPAEAGAADLVRCLPLRPIGIEQRIIFIGVTVRPAIDRDRSDVARRIEAPRTQHAAELVTD